MMKYQIKKLILTCLLIILVLNIDINPRFITALINSKLVSWLYTSSSAISVKDDFPQVTYEELKNLPIPIINFSLIETQKKELLDQFIQSYYILF